jgi:hypothetical protein
MWAEALNLGAYDVLPQPYEARDVFHVLTCAWQSWSNENRRLRDPSRSHLASGSAA